MQHFPQDIQFKYPWRKYQLRVLDELDDHLNDKHLHVVAPPGSGKTILGLEVALRLNQPTLILAPSLAIRNQWIQRFCDLFLQTAFAPGWISTNIRKPGFLTVATYQSLHAACKQKKNSLVLETHDAEEPEDAMEFESEDESDCGVQGIEALAAVLKSVNLQTIVIDEAHHLKNEWWQSLNSIKAIIQPSVVGLTATPPYDVTGFEWARYLDLNGPVDTEISVPELVIEGDLCPHQDFLFLTEPTQVETASIDNFRIETLAILESSKNDEVLIGHIKELPFWQSPLDHLEWIYDHLEVYSACLIYLNEAKQEIPETAMRVIGDVNFQIPNLSLEWLEKLLQWLIFDSENLSEFLKDHVDVIEKKLRSIGAINQKQICLENNLSIEGILKTSLSKLNGIKQIVDFELNSLGNNLRMVILTDYIRKEYLLKPGESETPLLKIGVLPIFEKLRRENKALKKLGILTGSLVIIPVSALPALAQKARMVGVEEIQTCPLANDFNFLIVQQNAGLNRVLIRLITEIFEDGEIEVLIGTKSLLGEGWDAPAINTLLLASFVGSFVLSNQMRGRAIRTLKDNPGKTGHIWHIACVDKSASYGGVDLDVISRRFKSFVGISHLDNGHIQNGINRLMLPNSLNESYEIEKYCQYSFGKASERNLLKEKWNKALSKGTRLSEEIRIPYPKREKRSYKASKSLYMNKTLSYLSATLGSGIAAYISASQDLFFQSFKHIKSLEDVYMLLAVIFAVGVGLFGRLAYKTLNLFIKYRDISKDIEQIGNALLDTLLHAGLMEKENKGLTVEAIADESGAVTCHLSDCGIYNQTLFIGALKEIIGEVDKPRYIMIRYNKVASLYNQMDYHAVPECIGKNKRMAEYFKEQWDLRVGLCELHYTKSLEGREVLLKARIHALSAQFEDKAEHINQWVK